MTDTTAKLYYEAHITIDPYPADSDLARSMEEVCRRYNLRVSTFLMFHEDDKTPKAFASARSISYDDIKARVVGAVIALKRAGHVVKRYKIEDTLLDSRHELDPLQLDVPR